MKALHSKIFSRTGAAVLILVLVTAACATSTTPTSVPASNPVSAPAATVTTAPVSPATATPAPTATVASGAANPTQTPAASTDKGTAGSAVKYVLAPAKSEASYSVREQLAQHDLPNDAVGKTNAVAGSVTINSDGSIDSANSKFTVDANTLQTDQSMRDNYVKRNILQTSQYPQIVFVPKQVSGLPAALPQSGDVSFTVTGDLTIRNVTKSVIWEVTGSIANGEATGKATTSFTFEEFNLSQPQVPVVLSVVNKITLGLTIVLQASN